VKTRAEWESIYDRIEADLAAHPPEPCTLRELYAEAESVMAKMDAARRRRYREAVEEQMYPPCRVPGCCFRGPVCPVHSEEEPPGFRSFDSMIRQTPSGGRRGRRG
jgi:hypothetical protein